MTIIVTNTGMQVLARVSWQRAAVLLATDIAFNVDVAPLVRVVHSPQMTTSIRAVITVKKTAYRPWHGKNGDSYASTNVILARDRWTCLYCEDPASTVDHILPKSRGGPSTFSNQVAACHDCNGRKADRTPAEAGMQLRSAPYVYDPWAEDQKSVRLLFSLQDDPQ